MSGPDPFHTELAAELRAASAAVQALPCEPDERDRWQARLIAITQSAKRDSARARRRLVRFRAELDARITGMDTGDR
mgnify:CR=1 FL=1